MIRIHRPDKTPAVLLRRGAAECGKSCRRFDRSPERYKSGEKKFAHKATIYAAAAVKKALATAQHDKCAFCECKVSALAYGDVEHFRPKAGYQQSPADELHKPGYYWLAYQWSNLFFSCQICNQQGKKNLFPLADPRRRACCHRDDLTAERPLLIDPAQEDPERFIGFRQEIAFPRNRQRIGKVTIEVLGLNREALREKRRDYLAPLLELKKQRMVLLALIAERGDARPVDLLARLHEIDELFVACREDSAEFAAMARCALG